jgi:hypothetical protein
MKNTNYQKIAVVLLALIGLFLAPAIFAEEEKTVLDRVKIVDDPELAEIIRITKRNLPQLKLIANAIGDNQRRQLNYEADIAKAKAIRTVTEIYSQIKLLDEKIKQINIRIDRSKTTKEIESELLLAKSTLEAERLTKIAELRETMNWTPWTPFGFKENDDLNAWVRLDIIDDVIQIYEVNKPYYEGCFNCNDFTHLSSYSSDDTIKYLEGVFKRPDARPIRIALFATKEGSALAENLKEHIKLIAKNAKADFQTDLASGIEIINTKYSTLEVANERTVLYEKNDYNIEAFADYIKRGLHRPGNIPVIYQITYRENLNDKAKELEDALNAVIKELGYTKYVKVENKGLAVKK